MNTTHLRRSAVATVLAITVLASFGACGGDSVGPASESTASEVLGGVEAGSEAPAACQDAFPLALAEADLGEVTMLPADWPAAPVEATLCSTSATLDDTIQTADFASEATPAEVLAAYKTAMPKAWGAVIEDKGAGETLSGTADGTAFEVSTRDGAYSIALSAS